VKMFDVDENRMIGLPYGEKNYDDMLSRFHLIPERYGRTDRQTDRFAISKNDKKDFTFWLICGLSPNLGLVETLGERLINPKSETNNVCLSSPARLYARDSDVLSVRSYVCRR